MLFTRLSVALIGLSIGLSAHAAVTQMPLDTAASQLHWTGSKIVGSSHNGTVKITSGKIDVEKNTIKGGEFVIDMTSIEVVDLKDKAKDKLKLENHLKSDDFFGAQLHPTANFKITKVSSPSATKGFTHDIVGDLTIKGKTSSVTIPSRITMTPGEATAEGTVEVDRTKFDVKFGSKKFFENLVGDKVIDDKFKIDIKLIAKK